MKNFSHIDFDKFSLFDLSIFVLSAIRKNFSTNDVFLELKTKINEANKYISSENENSKKLKKLLDLFYKDWGFSSCNGIYKLSESLWIDQVLKTRNGTAISLGIIFLHIAKSLDLPLSPVMFPTQLILRGDFYEDEMLLIDPFNGEKLDKHILESWIKGNINPSSELSDHDLDIAKPLNVVKKMLNILKSALMEEKNMELALNVINVLLKMNPNDPYEIRDRGLIYSQLDCDHIALNDLVYFIEHCPDDPISEIIKIQIHSIEQKKVILH